MKKNIKIYKKTEKSEKLFDLIAFSNSVNQFRTDEGIIKAVAMAVKKNFISYNMVGFLVKTLGPRKTNVYKLYEKINNEDYNKKCIKDALHWEKENMFGLALYNYEKAGIFKKAAEIAYNKKEKKLANAYTNLADLLK